MNTAKSEVTEMLSVLPENCSLEDIQYHLYVLEKINRGLDRIETEGTIPHAEAKERLKRWLTD
ncbi:MAG: hypothetical protein CVV14_10920 [Gammaproteobacteria bacterium HGW-Gammaproteobacteria-4]|jgi:hypothetical protein|nr:MAG: hypothetical protein CVV14_10920 [Gammaproteobacteria bacterium HGW-Gammaproteobacteria-4]